MLTHRIPKVMRLFSGNEIRFADPFGFGPTASLAMATFAEFLCSIAVAIGLGTRIATVPLIFTMMVAVLFAHADDPFGTKEKPLLFALVYFGLFVFGSGKYSIDQLITNRR
jgi:putative oxidoreductase